MRQDWHVTGNLEIEKDCLHPLRNNVMRWLDQDVTRIGNREHLPISQLRCTIRRNVIISTWQEPQRNSLTVEYGL